MQAIKQIIEQIAPTSARYEDVPAERIACQRILHQRAPLCFSIA